MSPAEITCESCGERNPAGSSFCLFCGAFLDWERDGRAAGEPAAGQSPRSPSESRSQVPLDPRRTSPEPEPAWTGVPVVDAPQPAGTVRLSAEDALAPAAGAAGGRQACGSCGTSNDVARRFCVRCGLPLRPRPVAALPPPPRRRWWQRWWHRFSDTDERLARRAYRRSLPALYRWRRLVLSLAAAALVVAVPLVVGRNPVQFVRTAWHDLRGDLVTIEDLTATAEPAGSELPGQPAGNAVDRDPRTAWSTPWAQRAPGSQCSALSGSAALQLRFPAARVREIRLVTGVADPSQRPLQLLPRVLFLTGSDQSCRVVDTVGPQAAEQRIPFDSEVAITGLRIVVAQTHDATDPRTQPTVSLGEVTLMARPA